MTPNELLALFTALGVGGAFALVVAALIIGAMRFMGRWIFGEVSADIKIRRDFAAATGNQIASIANEHYWAIANAAGTLSAGLRSYLEGVEIRLYLRWTSREVLEQELAALAEDVSSNTFPSLVQLVWSLHNFQFAGSNDYLLPDRSASTHLRRLYNRFRHSVRSVDGGDDLATGILQNGKRKDDKFDMESTVDTASRRTDKQLEGLRRSWTRWLASDLPNVLSATESLETFSRLLQYQLAELYKDWFRDQKINSELETVQDAIERKAWFGVMRPAELATLAAVREQDDSLSALRRSAGGLASPSQKESRADTATKAPPDEPRGPPPGRGDGPSGGGDKPSPMNEGVTAAIASRQASIDLAWAYLGTEKAE